MQDLGTLGGQNSAANDINDFGQIVGEAEKTPGLHTPEAFLYSAGVMQDLGVGIANSINDAGQVVGYALPERSCTVVA